MPETEPTYVVNELLMYSVSRLDADTPADVMTVVNNFYCDEAVVDAKNILWQHYGDLAALGKNIGRRTKLKHVEDVIEAIRTIDIKYPDRATLPVVFVALNLKCLPLAAEEGGVEHRIAVLEAQMSEVLRNVATPPAPQPQKYSAVVDPSHQESHAQQSVHGHPGGARQPGGGTQPRPSRMVPTQPVRVEHHTNSSQRPQLRPRDVPTQSLNGSQRFSGGEDDQSWNHVTYRKRNTVYGKKKSDGLKAPARRYEIVVFNVTSESGAEDVKSYMSDCDVKVEDVKKLSGDTSTVQSFKVDVAYKDKDIVLNSDFWPQDIGCRPYFRRRGNQRKEMETTQAT